MAWYGTGEIRDGLRCWLGLVEVRGAVLETFEFNLLGEEQEPIYLSNRQLKIALTLG